MARALFAGATKETEDPDDLAAQLRAFGAGQADIAAARRRADTAARSSRVSVHSDCVEALTLFQMLTTQWTRAGMAGVRTGLDYTAIEPTARMAGIAITSDLFDDIRAMEAAAIAEMARSRASAEMSRRAIRPRGGAKR